jgi:hypothetical protein
VKKALIYFVVTIVLIASIGKAFVVTAFFINQKAIAQTLCVNKNAPAKKCNGKCYLKKELAQVNSENKSEPQRESISIFEDFVWCQNDNAYLKMAVSISEVQIPFSLGQVFAFLWLHQKRPSCQ